MWNPEHNKQAWMGWRNKWSAAEHISWHASVALRPSRRAHRRQTRVERQLLQLHRVQPSNYSLPRRTWQSMMIGIRKMPWLTEKSALALALVRNPTGRSGAATKYLL